MFIKYVKYDSNISCSEKIAEKGIEVSGKRAERNDVRHQPNSFPATLSESIARVGRPSAILLRAAFDLAFILVFISLSFRRGTQFLLIKLSPSSLV